jgi:hypothetical protein
MMRLALGVGVFLDAPEDAKVVEHATCEFDVRAGFGCERREFFLERRSADGAAAPTDTTTRAAAAAAHKQARQEPPVRLARVIRAEFKGAINGAPPAWRPRSLAGRARSE